ncbi:hypothetical protein CWC02_04530 [Pseudoalteromonas sp. S2721]|uniref:S8 family serine peptidase n=1 Tax=Pseudoalteromonas sp. S2721 TaxID=579526 RepID=UPI00110BA0B3|nr:S8 family serine peptidase [Pseudoalteromonas sp. S2721]TMP20797.1 hypothetical protein CWC02_04530 [Pseudoalteromonas sp. S2721]
MRDLFITIIIFIILVPLSVKASSATDDNSVCGIGFVDSGVDKEHPAIKGLIAEYKDFTGEGLEDFHQHGTDVVLMYLNKLQNKIDIAQLGGKSSSFMTAVESANQMANCQKPKLFIAKVVTSLPEDKESTLKRVAKAIRWLGDKNIKVVNISIAIPTK